MTYSQLALRVAQELFFEAVFCSPARVSLHKLRPKSTIRSLL